MKEKKLLVIQTHYIPNRLSTLCLADAYKLLLPIIKREYSTLNEKEKIKYRPINIPKKEQKK